MVVYVCAGVCVSVCVCVCVDFDFEYVLAVRIFPATKMIVCAFLLLAVLPYFISMSFPVLMYCLIVIVVVACSRLLVLSCFL